MNDLMARLRAARRADEGRLKQVAGAVGVSFQAVQRWETGADRPSFDRMRKWLRAVDLPREWSDIYFEFRGLEQLDVLMARYAVADEYRPGIRVSFRDGLRNGLGRDDEGPLRKKVGAGGSSR